MENFAVYEVEIGYIKIGYRGNTLSSLKVIDFDTSELGVKTDFTDSVFSQLQEYFRGSRKVFETPLCFKTSPFGLKVMEALKQIPYGEVRTYKEVAEMIGMPKASRAVGGACNRNPILILIPCHRVVGSSGKLVGYAGGIELKAKLLSLEGVTD